MIQVYHNSRCGKSRCAVQLLEESGQAFEIKAYLQEIPTHEELKIVLEKLGIKPIDLIRKKETVFIEKYKGKSFTDTEWIDIMIKNPILIERPIVINGNKAVIARPAELLLGIL